MSGILPMGTPTSKVDSLTIISQRPGSSEDFKTLTCSVKNEGILS